MIRVVFMGSPDFSVPSLKALAQQYKVVGVVTQPDRPAGRGRELKVPPVKIAAAELGLAIIQPARLRAVEAMDQLRVWSPDLIVVAAFGQILRPDVLALPGHGCVNVHASLLPRWRGAAPIQAAILAGDAETGITIMQMDQGVDTGGILAQEAIALGEQDTGGKMFEKLAGLGADLLIKTLPHYLSGELKPQAQDESKATYAPMLKKEDGLLDFNRAADELARKVRAFNPWPGAFMDLDGQPLKIHAAHAETGTSPAGKRLIYRDQAAVGAGSGLLVLDEVQPAGKKSMSGKAFLSGARKWVQ